MRDFTLKALRLGEYGVDCKYCISETSEDGVVTENEYHVKASRPIHSDFRMLFDGPLTQVVTAILFGGELTAQKAVPTGINLAGKDDNIGISITGELSTEVGRVRFRTPRVKYLAGDSVICTELTLIVADIIRETEAYLFEGKSEELEEFNGNID